MLLRDPCKKCIVRACCQEICHIKADQVNTISYITDYKNRVIDFLFMCKEDWIPIVASLIFSSFLVVEIAFIGYYLIKIIKN